MEVELKILQELKEDKNKKTFSEDTLRISRGAFETIKAYAKLCSRIAGSGMECYGYLLMPKDSLDGTITNIYFADEQIVNPAHVRVTDEAVYNASKIMEPQGYQIVGWWHSHGDMEPFHSGWDRNNFVVVTQSVSPRTMYRTKELVYIADEEKKEVKFDTITIQGIDAKKFKESRPRILKNEEAKPYAFSMVVNNRGQYYIERRSKTFNERANEYELNEPIRPKFEVVDVEHDLEFFISGIEKDIHRKLIFPNENYASFSKGCPDWELNPAKFRHALNKQRELAEFEAQEKGKAEEGGESEAESMNKAEAQSEGEAVGENREENGNGRKFASQYTGIIEKFSDAAVEYLTLQDNSPAATMVAKFLLANSSHYRYDILRDTQDRRINKGAVKKIVEKVNSNKEQAQSNILNALTDTDCKVYFDRSRKLEINELRNLLCSQFMLEFNHAYNKYQNNVRSSQEFVEAVERGVRQYRKRTLKLAESFAEAVLVTKALTYYAMESMTDYKQQKNHKYKGLMTKMLSNLSSTNQISFLDSVGLELKYGAKHRDSKEFFLYPERFNVVNQLTKELYYYKLEAEKKSQNGNGKELNPNKKRMLEFLTTFVDIYANEDVGEEKADKLIEESIFPCLSITDYVRFQDGKKALRNYTEEDKKLHASQESRWSFITKPFKKVWTYKREGTGIVREEKPGDKVEEYDRRDYDYTDDYPGGVRHMIESPPPPQSANYKGKSELGKDKNMGKPKARYAREDKETKIEEPEKKGKKDESDLEERLEEKMPEKKGNGKEGSRKKEPWDEIAKSHAEEAKQKRPYVPRIAQYQNYKQKIQVHIQNYQQSTDNSKRKKKKFKILFWEG